MAVDRLYYWPGIPGRGEFVRLILEDVGAAYIDVVRLPPDQGGGVAALLAFLKGDHPGMLPYAPPIYVSGELVISQTANICAFLGRRHGLVPGDEASQLAANQLQLTIADVAAEAHDTHHPISTGLYYADQQTEAVRRAPHTVGERLPKYLGYFERVLTRAGGEGLLGAHSYVDLSMFQLLEGLAYMFPNGFARLAPSLPGLLALRDRVRARPRLAAYLTSPRRLAFNEHGLFRHYPELDPS